MCYYQQLLLSATHKARRPSDRPITIQVISNSDGSIILNLVYTTFIVTQFYFHSQCAWLLVVCMCLIQSTGWQCSVNRCKGEVKASAAAKHIWTAINFPKEHCANAEAKFSTTATKNISILPQLHGSLLK